MNLNFILSIKTDFSVIPVSENNLLLAGPEKNGK